MAIPHSIYREAGRVRIDPATCNACGLCAAACPAEVLRRIDGGVEIHPESSFGCIACGHCMMVCPTGSVTVTGRGIAPEDLIDAPAADRKATPEALDALLVGRRSVRRFSDREIPRALLDRILQMSASAPMGIPPSDVGVAVISGHEAVRGLAGEVASAYEGFQRIFRPWTLAAMRPFMRRDTYEVWRWFLLPLAEEYVSNHRAGRDAVFYNAPAVLVFHRSPFADPADPSIACTYAMLAAESLGLGSTMIGGAPPIIARSRTMRRRLGIPEGHTPVLALILGYPAAHFRRAIRRRLARVTRVESP